MPKILHTNLPILGELKITLDENDQVVSVTNPDKGRLGLVAPLPDGLAQKIKASQDEDYDIFTGEEKTTGDIIQSYADFLLRPEQLAEATTEIVEGEGKMVSMNMDDISFNLDDNGKISSATYKGLPIDLDHEVDDFVHEDAATKIETSLKENKKMTVRDALQHAIDKEGYIRNPDYSGDSVPKTWH